MGFWVFFGWVFYCQPCLALVEHAQIDKGRTVASAPETDERRRCSEIVENNDVLLKSYGTVLYEKSAADPDPLVRGPRRKQMNAGSAL